MTAGARDRTRGDLPQTDGTEVLDTDAEASGEGETPLHVLDTAIHHDPMNHRRVLVHELASLESHLDSTMDDRGTNRTTDHPHPHRHREPGQRDRARQVREREGQQPYQRECQIIVVNKLLSNFNLNL